MWEGEKEILEHLSVCVCVCVLEGERQSEREKKRGEKKGDICISEYICEIKKVMRYFHVYVCVY